MDQVAPDLDRYVSRDEYHEWCETQTRGRFERLGHVVVKGAMYRDGVVKLPAYFQAPSIVHDLIVHPDQHQVVHHRRAADGLRTATAASGTLKLDPPGINVNLTPSTWTEPGRQASMAWPSESRRHRACVP